MQYGTHLACISTLVADVALLVFSRSNVKLLFATLIQTALLARDADQRDARQGLVWVGSVSVRTKAPPMALSLIKKTLG